MTLIAPRLPKADIIANGVVLKPFEEGYISDRYISWLNDAEIVRFSQQRFWAHSHESCREFLAGIDFDSWFFWAIFDDCRGHIGNITAQFDRYNNVADLGILIGERSAQGAGRGTAAWCAACDWLIDRGVRKLTAGTMAANSAMLKVMEKSGMHIEGRRVGHFLFEGAPTDLVMAARFSDPLALSAGGGGRRPPRRDNPMEA